MKRRILVGLFVLAFAAGCGKGGLSSKREEQLIEKAKSDFMNPDVVGIADFAFDIIEMAEDFESPPATTFDHVEVTEARMFDYVKMPKDEAYWAVELDFVARSTETDEERYGTAILQYGSYVVNGVYKEADLMFSLTGTTEQEIENNRAAVGASLNSVRAASKMMR